jgi:colicin import membrane protein
MPAPRPLRLAPEWDDRFTRMTGVSAAAHVVAAAFLILAAERAGPRPLPLVAYTVEITDPSALGGRLPPGAPGKNFAGGTEAPPAPAAKAAHRPEPPPAEAAPKPEPKPEAKAPEPEVRIPDKPKPPEPKPEAKKPEPKTEPKPEARAEAKRPEPPKPAATAAAKPTPAAPPAKSAAVAGAAEAGHAGASESAPRDAYAAAAERWRERAGGGLGGTDAGSGPLGAGGEGPGGGGQLVGVEFLAYRQQVINAIKARWTNVIGRPGLVASVYFKIAPDGTVSGVRIQQSSGHVAYDASALRAVQHASPLTPPPARYQRDFGEFVIEFHSEERGGQDVG